MSEASITKPQLNFNFISTDATTVGQRRIRITTEHRDWMLQIRSRYPQEVKEFIQSFSQDGTTPGERSFELLESINRLEGEYDMLRKLMGKEEVRIPLPPDVQRTLEERRRALGEYLRRIQSGEITVA